MSKFRRHKFLVNKAVQFRYMGLVAVPLAALLGALYYLIYYAVFNEMLIPEAISVTLLPAMRKVNFVLALAMPVLFYMLLRAALVYSNRIIGPIPRLERELDRAIGGDYSVRLKTRDKDELSSFVTKINTLLEKVDDTCRKT